MTVWLSCEVQACHFHLGQSWWPKIQSLGLSKQNGSKNYVVRQFLKKIFGLSLLSPAEGSGCFAFDFIYNLPNDRWVEQFVDYRLEYCIDADSRFSPPIWSEYSASSFRATNACESFHSHFSAFTHSEHPNIFVLYLHCKKYKFGLTSRWEASLHENWKKSATIKKWT